MKKHLLIIGAGGHGKVIADIALKMKKWKSIKFLDDDENVRSSMGIEVIGKLEDAIKYINFCDIFVGIGNNETREKIQERLQSEGAVIPVLIHPTAIIGEQVEFGAGTVVMAGAIINCCTRIGKGCIINTGATIDHDNLLEDYVHISPGVHIAGDVYIGRSTWIGIGAIIKNNISIVSGCILGAGAVVVKNITESGIYVGIPSKKIGEVITHEKSMDIQPLF